MQSRYMPEEPQKLGSQILENHSLITYMKGHMQITALLYRVTNKQNGSSQFCKELLIIIIIK